MNSVRYSTICTTAVFSKSKLIVAASDYAAIGWIPLSLNGKVPLAKKWTEITLANWKEHWVETAKNIGIRTGPESGICVLDIDVKDNGLARWNEIIKMYEDPYTVMSRTGSGGLHYYFLYDKNTAKLKSVSKCRLGANGEAVGIDIKSKGGQVVAPPSIHPDTGKAYEFINDPSDFMELTPMPDWLYEMLLKSQDAKKTSIHKILSEELIDNKPLYGDMVNIAGEDVLLDHILLKEILSYIKTPSDATHWGGFLQNVKSIIMGPAKVYVEEVYDVFDEWSATGENYDMRKNAKSWAVSAGTGDIRTMIGMAVKAGMRKKKTILEIYDRNSRFYFDDFLALEDRTHTFEEIKSYAVKCIAFIKSLKIFWVIKTSNGYELLKNFADHKVIKFKVIIDGKMEKIALPALATMLMADLSFIGMNFIPYPINKPLAYKGFNLFPGFLAKIRPSQELIQPFIDHIKQIWCNNDETLFDYTSKWLGYLVQYPDRKPGTAIVIKSKQGAGKNIVVDFIGECVLGTELYLCTTEIDKVLGRFNSLIQGRKLIVLNEVGMSGSEWHNVNSRLKGLITEAYLTVERKGIEPQKINDCAAYIIMSNYDNPIRIEESDRRMFCLEASNARIGDTKYFDNLFALIKHPDAADALMAYLMELDLTDWNPAIIPITTMKEQMKYDHLPNPVKFVKETYLDDEEFTRFEIICSDLYDDYCYWCSKNGEKTLSAIYFGRNISSSLNIVRARKRINGKLNYIYTIDKSS